MKKGEAVKKLEKSCLDISSNISVVKFFQNFLNFEKKQLRTEVTQ